jgi:hypothetical protein
MLIQVQTFHGVALYAPPVAAFLTERRPTSDLAERALIPVERLSNRVGAAAGE